ncbi:MAG: hypothetical protein ACI9V1_000469 [Spirosomataceae bacterium]|jgi:hypothetical protein
MALTFDSDFLLRIGIDLISVFILVRGIYYRIYRGDDFLFTFFIFNILTFFIAYFLNKVNIPLGAAFGLFAVFSMLRYRTEGISMKNMTYLFMAIALGMLNAIGENVQILLILNGVILEMTILLESSFLLKRGSSKLVTYDVLTNLKPAAKATLLQDIESRTRLPVHREEIDSIDLLRDVAILKVYYHELAK